MQDPVFMTGVGMALPERILTNEQLSAGMPWLDLSAAWMAEHTGIRQRHVAGPQEHATDLGCRAAAAALQAARCDADRIDLILLATNTARLVYPAGAALIQQQLATTGAGQRSLRHAAALDLQQGCASFVAGIILAASMLQSRTAERALVIGADVATRMVDWTDRNAFLLGDGAAACVLDRAVSQAPGRPLALQILGSFMRTVPDRESIHQHGVLDAGNDPFVHIERARRLDRAIERADLYPAGDRGCLDRSHLFNMSGREVYRFVRRNVATSGYVETLSRSGLVAAEDRDRVARYLQSEPDGLDALGEDLLARLGARIDRFVPHGANMVLDQELADQMRIPYERMALALQDTGNTSAASVGIALSRLLRDRIRYATVAKRDAGGATTRPSREVVVEPLRAGHTALLLSFGAGASWNYVCTRAV